MENLSKFKLTFLAVLMVSAISAGMFLEEDSFSAPDFDSVSAQSTVKTVTFTFPDGNYNSFVMETTGETEISGSSGSVDASTFGNKCTGFGNGGEVTVTYDGRIKNFQASDNVGIQLDGESVSESEFLERHMACSVDSSTPPGDDDSSTYTGNDSGFEREVSVPACDTSNSEVLILDPSMVSSKDDLQAELNRDDKRIFCIKPGDYTELSGEWSVMLSASGSEDNRRYLRYYNPDVSSDTHPWNMDDPEAKTGNKRVILPRFRIKGSYWTLDRLRFGETVAVENGGHHTILNRLMFYDTSGDPNFVAVNAKETHHVWTQNSVFGDFPQWDTADDTCCFTYGSSGSDNLALNVKDADYIYFVDNEAWDMYNGDVVQTAAYGDRANIKRTVIADNDMWLNDDMRDEPYENAVDFKLGPSRSSPKSDWSVVQNNRIWNFKNRDEYMSWQVVSTHRSSNEAYIMKDNIFWGSQAAAISFSNSGSIQDISGNIIYNHETQKGKNGIQLGDGPRGTTVENNIVIDSGKGFMWTDKAEDVTVRNNVFINSDVGQPKYEPPNTVTENAFYNSQTFDGGTDGIDRGSASDANHQDLTFQVREITGPETYTIPNGQVTSSSPHASWFGK